MDEELPMCECGCGERVSKIGNRFVHGHNCRGIKCSEESLKRRSKAHMGHTVTEETRKKISDANRAPSEETREKMRKNHADVSGENNPNFGKRGENHPAFGKKRSREEREKMRGKNNGMYGVRGGRDIVNHHYIYDDSNLSLNTVQMTRSNHSKLHCLLGKIGYVVPHINATAKNVKLVAVSPAPTK